MWQPAGIAPWRLSCGSRRRTPRSRRRPGHRTAGSAIADHSCGVTQLSRARHRLVQVEPPRHVRLRPERQDPVPDDFLVNPVAVPVRVRDAPLKRLVVEQVRVRRRYPGVVQDLRPRARAAFLLRKPCVPGLLRDRPGARLPRVGRLDSPRLLAWPGSGRSPRPAPHRHSPGAHARTRPRPRKWSARPRPQSREVMISELAAVVFVHDGLAGVQAMVLGRPSAILFGTIARTMRFVLAVWTFGSLRRSATSGMSTRLPTQPPGPSGRRPRYRRTARTSPGRRTRSGSATPAQATFPAPLLRRRTPWSNSHRPLRVTAYHHRMKQTCDSTNSHRCPARGPFGCLSHCPPSEIASNPRVSSGTPGRQRDEPVLRRGESFHVMSYAPWSAVTTGLP